MKIKIKWYYNGPVPNIDYDGHSVVNINLIKEFLKKGYEIDFIYFNNIPDVDTEAFISSLGIDNIFFINRKKWFSRIINTCSYFFYRERERERERERGDIIILGSNAVIDFFNPKIIKTSRCFLIAGDVETRKWYQNKKISTIPFFVFSKLREYNYRYFNTVILYNKEDSKFLSHKSRKNNIFNSVCYKPITQLDPDKVYDVIFTGNFNYHPNEDAANFILDSFDDCDLKVALVGYNASKLKSANKNIIILESVPNLEYEIMRSKIFISPLNYGTGVKNKILSAINCSVPIVCSKLSAEGIPYVNKSTSIIIVNDRSDFKSTVLSSLNDISRLNNLAKDTKSKYDKLLSWDSFCDKVIKSLDDV